MRREKRFAVRAAVAASLAVAAVAAILGIFPGESRAEGISGFLEYDYTRNDTETADAGGQDIRTKIDSFTQLYNIALDKKIYPNLNLLASGLFRRRDDSIESEGVENDTTTTTLRPYVNLNLRTPLYYAEAAYSRNEEKVKSSGLSSVTTVRDSYISTLYWKPDRFPDLRFQFSRDHLYDKDRSVVDTTTDLYQLTSNYRPVEALVLRYQGTYRNTELRLEETTTKEMTHNGRVNYSNNWWRRRIAFGLDYNITNQGIETETTGAGEVGLRVFPSSGLSALSDTPENVSLVSNPALIDGGVAAGAGLDLGLPATPGGDTRLRNMGLDFLVATEINTLYVWADRDVAQVADAFSWRVYTSADNQNWNLHQTVFPAIYSPTFNRFEIRFTNVNARYIKVVAAPLSPVVPFASAFPTILVTELQAEIRRPASEVAGKLTSTFQNGTADFRAVILESVNLTYELTYFFTKRDPGDLLYTVSNGLSAFRQFNRVLSGRGRISFDIGEEQAGHREAIQYTASITAVPFQTLYQSLTFSGREETVAGQKDRNVSILLYNIARLYEGIDANLSGGISIQEDATGKENRTTQVNAGATFVPNRKASLTLLYNGTTTVASGGSLQGETTDYTRAGEAGLSVTPVQTVYLFGSYRIEKSTTFPSRNILNYSLNWSPFPDGTLHLTFFYNETVRSDDTEERSIVPSLRWYITRRSYLNLSYQDLKSETPAVTTSSKVYSGTVRISF
ncbi:MAG: hypothetical protein IH577_03390 [Deltaproteobacteria bacterium]|nr:hypothetical protein [Deltaproteobacteria bacterium]